MSQATLIDPATVPFPVERHFRMRPGLNRHEGRLTSPGADFDKAQVCVDDAIGAGWLPLGTWQAPGLPQAIAEARMLLSAELIGKPIRDEMSTGSVQATSTSVGVSVESDLLGLRKQVQEDLVFLSPGEQATVAALAVAMPSGWNPVEKLGLSFARIHAVVPEAPALVRNAAQMSRTILNGGPYRRFVWTLCGDDCLSQHPAQRQSMQPGGPVWWRVEQQTTVPLSKSGFCLFLIRVFHQPLDDILNIDPSRTACLVESLRSMTEAVIEYKSLGVVRETVLTRYG